MKVQVRSTQETEKYAIGLTLGFYLHFSAGGRRFAIVVGHGERDGEQAAGRGVRVGCLPVLAWTLLSPKSQA